MHASVYDSEVSLYSLYPCVVFNYIVASLKYTMCVCVCVCVLLRATAHKFVLVHRKMTDLYGTKPKLLLNIHFIPFYLCYYYYSSCRLIFET